MAQQGFIIIFLTYFVGMTKCDETQETLSALEQLVHHTNSRLSPIEDASKTVDALEVEVDALKTLQDMSFKQSTDTASDVAELNARAEQFESITNSLSNSVKTMKVALAQRDAKIANLEKEMASRDAMLSKMQAQMDKMMEIINAKK
eukprot:m.331447 g.331447  ORF g.331447 m.331447 type:complete len:147 (-) comp16730_c0_seq1:105-545(-)